VCPGTYNEQIVITQPVTLEGVTISDSAQAIIAVPSGGLVPNGDFVPQLWVNNASGSVNISDLTVDASGNGITNSFHVVGIFYENSSGTVNHVTTQNQSGNGNGVGIVALGGSSNLSVTIENSSIHDYDHSGIEVENIQASELTAVIKGNAVTTRMPMSQLGILIDGSTITAQVTSNLIVLPGADGIVGTSFARGSISGNTVVNAGGIGIVDQSDGVAVTSNKIFGSPTGIQLLTSVAAIQSNSITKSTTGVDFQCGADPNVRSNIIMDTGTALNSVPSAIAPRDAYFNVGTIRAGGC